MIGHEYLYNYCFVGDHYGCGRGSGFGYDYNCGNGYSRIMRDSGNTNGFGHASGSGDYRGAGYGDDLAFFVDGCGGYHVEGEGCGHAECGGYVNGTGV